jgi:hypothetical protein
LFAEKEKVNVERVVQGNLMTALDMAGISLTLLFLPPHESSSIWLQYLDKSVEAGGWPITSKRPPEKNTSIQVPVKESRGNFKSKHETS